MLENICLYTHLTLIGLGRFVGNKAAFVICTRGISANASWKIGCKVKEEWANRFMNPGK